MGIQSFMRLSAFLREAPFTMLSLVCEGQAKGDKFRAKSEGHLKIAIISTNTRAAYEWFTKECICSITTWDDMREKFILKFHHLSNHNEEETKKDDNPNEMDNVLKIFRIELLFSSITFKSVISNGKNLDKTIGETSTKGKSIRNNRASQFMKQTPISFSIDPTFECSACGALLWYAESMRGATNASSDSYSLCCGRGKVLLKNEVDEPPPLLKELITNKHPKSDNFIENIKRYNSMFAFTSMGGKQDTSVNVGRGPYCYRMHGENYHFVGPLLPETGKPAKFSQLYIFDTENEIQNRIATVSNGEGSFSSRHNKLDYKLTTDIRDLLDEINPLVKDFRMAGERIRSSDDQKISLRLIGTRPRDGRQYNLPTASEVAALILDFLVKELKDDHTFGRVEGVVYTIEFQKRGLPHCHILLWLEPQDKLMTTGKIDHYISAEILNKDEDPQLYQLVTNHMMHGPCCVENPSCPCMVDYKCTKKFPKQFNELTVIEDSVMEYIKEEMMAGSMKYLFKYINKGPDRVTATIDGEEVNEIKDYLNCRYLSSCEADWRIYGFDIHYRTPSIERIPFHLKDEQQKHRVWTRRKQGKSLGRIHHVPPSWGELYYLRAILNKVRGPMEWDELKKVDDVLYPRYRDACYARDSMSRPEVVWEKTWGVMVVDVLNVERIKQGIPDLELSDIQRKNICLTYIECTLRSSNKSLKDIQNMSYPNQEYTMAGYNILIFDETSYDPEKLKEQHATLYGSLTTEQKGIYSTVMNDVDNNKGGIFFVYGYGGTRKTYLYKTMSAALHSKRTDPSVVSDKVFGGKVVLFGGNFRQILPVITNGDMGNGKSGGTNDGQSNVVFPDDMLIQETDDDVGAIIDDTYPDMLRNISFFFPEYESSDSVCLANEDSNFDDSIYTIEFLNGLSATTVL
ncbi:putative PIF1 DNA helicase/replication protein A1-like protein [Tanacetum coccineum]